MVSSTAVRGRSAERQRESTLLGIRYVQQVDEFAAARLRGRYAGEFGERPAPHQYRTVAVDDEDAFGGLLDDGLQVAGLLDQPDQVLGAGLAAASALPSAASAV